MYVILASILGVGLFHIAVPKLKSTLEFKRHTFAKNVSWPILDNQHLPCDIEIINEVFAKFHGFFKINFGKKAGNLNIWALKIGNF